MRISQSTHNYSISTNLTKYGLRRIVHKTKGLLHLLLLTLYPAGPDGGQWFYRLY